MFDDLNQLTALLPEPGNEPFTGATLAVKDCIVRAGGSLVEAATLSIDDDSVTIPPEILGLLIRAAEILHTGRVARCLLRTIGSTYPDEAAQDLGTSREEIQHLVAQGQLIVRAGLWEDILLADLLAHGEARADHFPRRTRRQASQLLAVADVALLAFPTSHTTAFARTVAHHESPARCTMHTGGGSLPLPAPVALALRRACASIAKGRIIGVRGYALTVPLPEVASLVRHCRPEADAEAGILRVLPNTEPPQVHWHDLLAYADRRHEIAQALWEINDQDSEEEPFPDADASGTE